MKINNLAHVSFRVKDVDASLDFYESKLGFHKKFVLTMGDMEPMYAAALEKTPQQREVMLEKLRSHRDEICIAYVELLPGQFVELFSSDAGVPHVATGNHNLGYLHMALEVEDIKQAYEELKEKGVRFLTGINYGADHAYQLWIADPDGNEIELMQYCPDAYQLVGRR